MNQCSHVSHVEKGGGKSGPAEGPTATNQQLVLTMTNLHPPNKFTAYFVSYPGLLSSIAVFCFHTACVGFEIG